MTKIGSTLRLWLTDNSGRLIYEEPFTYTEYISTDLRKYLDAFEEGVRDALKDIGRDLEAQRLLELNARFLKSYSNEALLLELQRRGCK